MNKFIGFFLSGLVLIMGGFFISVAQAQTLTCEQLKVNCSSITDKKICSGASGCVPTAVRTGGVGYSCVLGWRCMVDENVCPNLYKDLNKCCPKGWEPDLWGDYTGTCVLSPVNRTPGSSSECRSRIDCKKPPPPPPKKYCCVGETDILRLVNGALETSCLAPDPKNAEQGLFWPSVLSSQCPRRGLPSQCESTDEECKILNTRCGEGKGCPSGYLCSGNPTNKCYKGQCVFDLKVKQSSPFKPTIKSPLLELFRRDGFSGSFQEKSTESIPPSL